MVKSARDYRLSSYRANAEDKIYPLLRPHGLHRSLASEEGEGRTACRPIVKALLRPQLLDEIRNRTNKGWALGCGRFQAEIERLTERRAAPLPKGRPKAANVG